MHDPCATSREDGCLRGTMRDPTPRTFPDSQGESMRTSPYLLAALAFGLTAAAARAAEPAKGGETAMSATPARAASLDEVYQKYLEARGGPEKLNALKSIRFTGKAMF